MAGRRIRRFRLQVLLPSLLVAAGGCQDLNLRSQSPDADPVPEDFETRVETPFIGEYITVSGLNLITLQGVGLAVDLDGTGGNPPPSVYRTMLRDDMTRRRVRNPEQILRSPNTALVVVRAYLPPLIRKRDTFDLEVRLPENSEATSLRGGRLMEMRLTEHALVPGRGIMRGKDYGIGQGHILISIGDESDESLAGVLRRGRIPAGGRSLKDRDLSVSLRNDFHSIRNAKRIADRIGMRFYDYNESGIREPLAKAITDRHVELKMQTRYRDNYPRYLQVIRNIAFRETDIARRVRMERTLTKLQTPITAERASLQLEAIGREAIPLLRKVLKSPFAECRFHAALALAYLNDASGVGDLTEAARTVPAFRVFAFAALSTVGDADAHLQLRDLLNERSAETRYGAFRALTILDANDPFLKGERLNDQFTLHVLDTTGDPMIHLTHHRKAEVVVFGAEQRLETPLVVRAGHHILVTAQAGSDTVVVSRYQPGRPDQRDEVTTRVADVIHKVVEFGGTYPDIVQLLIEADKQHNLAGTIAIDALPQAGRIYIRPDQEFADGFRSKTKVGNVVRTPNLFDASAEVTQESPWRNEEGAADDHPGTASATSLETTKRPATADEDRKDSVGRFRLLRGFRRSG